MKELGLLVFKWTISRTTFMILMDLHLIGKVHLLMNFDLILIYFSKYLKKNSVALLSVA